MNQRHGKLLLIAALIAASCWMRLDALTDKTCLERDEGTAYLAAAGKQARFAQNDLANRWVDASDWSAHHRIDVPFCFGIIRSDLIEYDLHPPLYFWLLHLAGLRNGLDLGTGAQLNIALHALAMALLFAFAWQVGRRFWLAMLTVAVWSFSPPVLSTTLLARQYELVGLLAIACFAALHWLMHTQRQRPLATLALGVGLFLAAFTHYQALLLAPAISVVAALDWGLHRLRSDDDLDRRAAILWPAAAVVASLLAFFLVQPEAWQEGGGEVSSGGARLSIAMTRVPIVLKTLTGFAWGYVLLLCGAVLLAVAWTVRVLHRTLRRESSSQRDDALRGALYSIVPLLLLGAPIVFLYVSFRTAQHAMGDRYLVLLWPFLALWLVQPLAWIRAGRGQSTLAAAGVILAIVAGMGAHQAAGRTHCWPRHLQLVEHYDAVVLNVTRRGRISPFFPHWTEGTAVFGGRQMEFFAHSDALLEGLAEQDDALVFHLRDVGVAYDSRARLARLFSEHGFSVGPADDPVVFIDPDALTIVLVAAEVEWPPGLLEWVEDLGTTTDRGQRNAGYALVSRQGEILAERVADGRSLTLSHRPSPGPMSSIVARMARPVQKGASAFLEIDLEDGGRLHGPGSVAVLSIDPATGRVLQQRLYGPNREWKPNKASFRVWRPRAKNTAQEPPMQRDPATPDATLEHPVRSGPATTPQHLLEAKEES